MTYLSKIYEHTIKYLKVCIYLRHSWVLEKNFFASWTSVPIDEELKRFFLLSATNDAFFKTGRELGLTSSLSSLQNEDSSG